MLADELLPVYDVSDEVAAVVDAEPSTVWAALLDADLIEVGKRAPAVGLLGALRALPELVSQLLHGELPPGAPESLRLRELTELPAGEGGWLLLAERPLEEFVLGLVGKFWRPVIEFASVDVEGFGDFAEPGMRRRSMTCAFDGSARDGPFSRD